MSNPMEPMLNLYEAQLQASKDLANIIIAGAEQIDKIALQATKDGLNEQMTYAQALAAVRDLQGAASLRTAFLQPNNTHALAFYQEMLKALSETYAGMTRTVEAYLREVGDTTTKSMSQTSPMMKQQAGPPGIMEFWNTAWRQLNTMTEQYTRAAQVASTNTEKAASAAAASLAPSSARNNPSKKDK